jgi:hypothetical protein
MMIEVMQGFCWRSGSDARVFYLLFYYSYFMLLLVVMFVDVKNLALKGAMYVVGCMSFCEGHLAEAFYQGLIDE